MNKSKLKPTLNVVLVEPEIPQNAGNIARTCAATGARLHIIKPIGLTIDDKKLKRAGLDYWYLLDITYYDNLNDFFSKNSGQFAFFTTKGRKTHSDIEYSDNWIGTNQSDLLEFTLVFTATRDSVPGENLIWSTDVSLMSIDFEEDMGNGALVQVKAPVATPEPTPVPTPVPSAVQTPVPCRRCPG